MAVPITTKSRVSSIRKTNDKTLLSGPFFFPGTHIDRVKRGRESVSFMVDKIILSDYIVFISFGAKRTRGSARSRMTWSATVTVTDGT